MADPFEEARNLVRTLLESNEAVQMRRMAALLKAERGLAGTLSELRQLQFAVQSDQVRGRQPLSEYTDRIASLTQAVELDPMLREYIIAETAYGRLLVEVQNILTEAFSPDTVPGPVRVRVGR
jgi:cell fate (sporulation/competence/biofilm development) regulator YlbF (YheA/YmcA/DUF963 family)